MPKNGSGWERIPKTILGGIPELTGGFDGRGRRRGGALEIAHGLSPDQCAHLTPDLPAAQVAVLEVDAAVASDSPASAEAALNVGQESVTSWAGTRSGSTRDVPAFSVTEAPNRSLPVSARRTWAAAALKVLWPEQNSGKAGVTTVGGW